VQRELANAVLAADLERPLPYGRSVRRHVTARWWILAEQSRRAISAPHDVDLVSPLMTGRFVDALARARWFLGLGSRTDAMRLLAGDLLPAPILERTSKASFNGAYWGAETRSFIAQWHGEGVDADVIDAEELKRMWSAGAHHAMTAGLLQQIWLAARE
jgi:asparagine synthase (glutamine-hydrolysing)